ncbi:MAG: NTP transferase domain-containing protein [Candidatus Heimdallarchaeota archaeon]|nr:NTP transferase domain-containing protein [Candidatus Heimdallarchaeota archaeon]MCK4954008.1 NTP transferase domain-containing protein [Candidatus Heimdallarchaeota archaeon]
MKDTVLSILAGGFSRRFQNRKKKWKDKALLSFNKVPLLVHLITQGIEYYEKISISVNSQERKRQYTKLIEKHKLSLIPDFIVDNKSFRFDGALLGITSSLRKHNDCNIQFIPSDRPFLNFQIFDKLSVNEFGTSFLCFENGMIEPLLCFYGSKIYIPPQFLQLHLSRADVIIRLSPHLQIYNATEILETNNLSPLIFKNINQPRDIQLLESKIATATDVTILPPRMIQRKKLLSIETAGEKVSKSKFLQKLIKTKNFYAAFLWGMYFEMNSKISREEYLDLASIVLKHEYQYWLDNKLPFLALHALQDLLQAVPEERDERNIRTISELKEKMEIKPRKTL